MTICSPRSVFHRIEFPETLTSTEKSRIRLRIMRIRPKPNFRPHLQAIAEEQQFIYIVYDKYRRILLYMNYVRHLSWNGNLSSSIN
jgi:hypothetical protein